MQAVSLHRSRPQPPLLQTRATTCPHLLLGGLARLAVCCQLVLRVLQLAQRLCSRLLNARQARQQHRILLGQLRAAGAAPGGGRAGLGGGGGRARLPHLSVGLLLCAWFDGEHAGRDAADLVVERVPRLLLL